MAAVLTVAGCGGDSTGPGHVGPSSVNGQRSFTLVAKTHCDFAIYSGDVVASIDFQGNDEVGNTVSGWSNDPADPDRYNLFGSVQWGSGDATLKFWREVLEIGFEVDGHFKSDGTFEGTATDPAPGAQPYMSIDGCSYNVRGHRTSS